MGNELLIRAYNVGVGDCIYVRIPDGNDGFHILIDCGTIGSIDYLKRAIQNLKAEMLPDADSQGKKRLHLIVATHRHRDHIKGFDPKLFENIEIKNIWLSPVMNKEHKQAEKAFGLHEIATRAMRHIEELGLSMSPQLQMLVSLYSLDNDDAMRALREDLPKKNKIKPKYVHAGMSGNELGLNLKKTTIRVLAPENDIDGYYLGKEFDESLKGLKKTNLYFLNRSKPLSEEKPINISLSDFRLVQSRLLSNAFGFAETDSSLQNNTSIVLLIEWRKRRLLFTGDAEWEKKYSEGRHNGSWNVMWKKRKKHLRNPVDFLKIGHHGSINATPWIASKDQTYGVNTIFNSILPLPESGKKSTAHAIISTQRTKVYETIPSSDLLNEIGRRVANTRKYYNELEKNDQDFYKNEPFEGYWDLEREDCLKKFQPMRTDLENTLTGKEYVEVKIEPGD